jgi:hypothetical protein
MHAFPLSLAAVTALLAAVSTSPASEPADVSAKIAVRIDTLLAERWTQTGFRPVGRSDDAEFLRRAYLDLTGKVPPVAEVRRFLTERSATKRQDLIERLLQGPGYVTHFRNLWRDRLLLDPEADVRRLTALAELDQWLEQQFATNVRYDRMVRTLLTLPLAERRPSKEPDTPTPVLFYLGREDKPEVLASGVTRLFLGIRLECAQCHDHPHAPWTRDVFWSQAAFFAGLRQDEKGLRKLAIPGAGRDAALRFLDDQPLPGPPIAARSALADWMTAPQNPYFARAAVNRLWEHFFGIGLVDPVDDMTAANRPSHPELLDQLAAALVAARYDQKVLIRALLLSDAYQRTSAETRTGATIEPRLFGRMNVKALSPGEIFDSLIEATGYRAPDLPVQRTRFLARFPRSERRLEGQGSIPRALTLMNGDLIAAATKHDGDNTLSAVLASPFLDTGGRVETLFLAALGRLPRPEEKERLVKYVDNASSGRALDDVFWALLNSAEFVHNH